LWLDQCMEVGNLVSSKIMQLRYKRSAFSFKVYENILLIDSDPDQCSDKLVQPTKVINMLRGIVIC